MKEDLYDKVFAINNEEEFLSTALTLFRYQAEQNALFGEYLNALGRPVLKPEKTEESPFLPVTFYRTHKVMTGDHEPSLVFESSSTAGTIPGKHYVADKSLYERSFIDCFSLFYGDPSDYLIAAILPSYSERGNSSLVYMMDGLIRRSLKAGSGFYNNNYPALLRNIEAATRRNEKILVLGVSFALLELAEKFSPDLSGTIVMETGGMKGRRKEITREELHTVLKERLNIDSVHSEYGMTELMSQAYSSGNGIFRSPPWMKVFIRDPHDPLEIFESPGRTGGINIIDLANIHSCSFIATGDLGRLHDDGSFEVLGRFDESDIRGCNLLFE
ncbi:MAG TPA: hypothetical protein VK861_05480 [Bacteroidales bacterium]|nr:hypothetical protein [Bacteroidales bacterium]